MLNYFLDSNFSLIAIFSVDFYCRKIKYKAIRVLGRNTTNSCYLLYLTETDMSGVQKHF